METILLVGNPNSGKSTIFNLLSGKNRKVSNYAGISVDEARGELLSNPRHDRKISVVDLPGIQSLYPGSLDEAVTIATLMGINKKITNFDLVAVVLDLAKFESSLALVLWLKDLLGDRLIVIVNKIDMASKQKVIDWKHLERILRSKILVFSAHQDKVESIDDFIRFHLKPNFPAVKTSLELPENAREYFFEKSIFTQVPEQVISQELAHQKLTEYQTEARKIAVEVDQSIDPKILSLTRKIDGVVLHPIFGGAIFFGIFYLVFHAIYTWSSPLMDAMEALVGSLGELLAGVVHVEWMKSLLVDGILGGVGGVVVFLPQIVILFFLISLMEQSGYISRAAFITDRSMSWFGLSGRAFLPFLSGFACAIPSIMAARNIANKKERMATMMVLPFITCSARLPVFILLIGTFIPARTVYGIFQTQALALFFLYFLGSIIALVSAKLLRLSLFKGKSDSFIMDLPIYQRPKISWAWKHAWGKGKTFLTKAGTTILMLSMVLWLLSTFPKPAEELLAGKTENQIKSLELENSAIGRLGKLIEPAIAPLGYDWKMGVGILVAFGARELFVSTLGTLYALADANEESESLRTMLATETKADGTPTYSLAVVWSLLIFFVIALQCISTYATMKRETGGHKWPLIQLIAMTCLAYLGSWLTYSLLN